MALIILVVLVLNLGISYWNAYAVGKAWVESKYAGGWPRFLTWMGAIMSASGFTWCYLIIIAMVLATVKILTVREIEVALDVGYVIVIPGIIFSGLMITIDAWARTYREHSYLNLGVAAYDTFAQAYNTYNAIQGIGPALSNILDFFKGDDDSGDGDDIKGFIIILAVIIALAGGIITTTVIIKHQAGSEPLPERPLTHRRYN